MYDSHFNFVNMLLSQIKHELADFHGNPRFNRVIRLDLNEFVENYDYEMYETEKHYVSVCPWCSEHLGYIKKKLYIEKSDDTENLKQGFCQRCRTIYFHTTTDLSFELITRRDKEKLFSLSRLPSFIPGSSHDLRQYLDFTSSKPDIEILLRSRNNAGYRYIPYIEELGMKGKITNQDTNQGFIMFPFRLPNQSIFYWQSKLFGFDLPYFMPTIDHKPFYCPVYRGNKIVVCEGIFDALACMILFPDRTTIALLGCYATPYHIWMLRHFISPTDCLIFLDNIHLSINLLFQLKGSIPTITSFNCVYNKYNVDPDETLAGLDNDKLKEYIDNNRYEDTLNWELKVPS